MICELIGKTEDIKFSQSTIYIIHYTIYIIQFYNLQYLNILNKDHPLAVK